MSVNKKTVEANKMTESFRELYKNCKVKRKLFTLFICSHIRRRTMNRHREITVIVKT